MPPPGDQGRQQSCVGWSVAYALKSYQEAVEENVPLVDGGGRADAGRVFSPAFIYNQINNGRDGGSRFIDALNLLSNQGAARWADMPYNPGDFRTRPTAQALQAARRYRIDYWRQVNAHDQKEIKAQLNAGYPVLIGAKVDEGFMRMRAGQIWRFSSGAARGAHAMVLVGYDDSKSAFKLINSWGMQWGDRGYGWVEYAYLSRVLNEAYVAKDAINGPGPAPQPQPEPQPQPQPRAQVEFRVTEVKHNQRYPDRPELYMVVEGNANLPAHAGQGSQIVIHFFFDAGNGQKGQPVRTLIREFSTVNGCAATGTPPFRLPAQGPWRAWIRYDAFDLPAGQNFLVAEAVLFIDNFGVQSSPPIPFRVSR
jgi:hypothetical protein